MTLKTNHYSNKKYNNSNNNNNINKLCFTSKTEKFSNIWWPRAATQNFTIFQRFNKK